jgi:hypothetical protein
MTALVQRVGDLFLRPPQPLSEPSPPAVRSARPVVAVLDPGGAGVARALAARRRFASAEFVPLAARDDEAETVLGCADLVVLVVPPDAPESLAAAVAAGVAAPVCRVTSLPAGISWPWRHRAAARAVAEALR